MKRLLLLTTVLLAGCGQSRAQKLQTEIDALKKQVEEQGPRVDRLTKAAEEVKAAADKLAESVERQQQHLPLVDSVPPAIAERPPAKSVAELEAEYEHAIELAARARRQGNFALSEIIEKLATKLFEDLKKVKPDASP